MSIDENRFFREATLRLCGSLHIERALDDFFQYIQRVIPVSLIRIFLIDPDLNATRIIAGITSDGKNNIPRIIPLLKAEHWFSDWWESCKPVEIINQPRSIRFFKNDVLKKYGIKPDSSILQMPLEMEGNRLAMVAFVAEGTDQYTDEHAGFLLMLHRPFTVAISNSLKHQELHRLKDLLADDNRFLHRQIQEFSSTEIIGAEFGLKAVVERVLQVVALDTPVLLMGETGVGKDVIANAIHYSSPRKDGPFIKVNCGAIPDQLIESELFGHEKGAFTGAIGQKRGRFERAHKGTIFLDEISELPLQAQTRLLHVLQNKEIERVGGTETIALDIRIISASNRNLQDMVTRKIFREDIWFRLNVFPIIIPPLRQRKNDIPELIHYFLEKKSRELRLDTPWTMAPGTLESLMAYDWPGNVRELENLVERALIQNTTGILSFDSHITPSQQNELVTGSSDQNTVFAKLDNVTSQHISKALKLAKGKINGPGGCAELLGVNPSTLRKRMKKLGIPYGRPK